MKARKGAPSRLRQALDRGAPFLEQGLALFKANGRDIVFTLLVMAGLILYLARPERTEQWVTTGHWWDALLHYPGLEESAARFEGEALLRPPADYSQSGLTALATFGALDYLGADTAVTWGQDGAAHLWLAVHDLARPAAVRSGDYVVDHLLLPEATVEGVIAVQVEAGGAALPVSSPILHVEEGMRLFIWQK
jgi:hypothetical protein